MLKDFLNAYLNITYFFVVRSEEEMNNGFTNLCLEPFLAKYEDMKYSYLIELKYFPRQKNKKSLKNLIKSKKSERRKQLQQYVQDKYVQKRKDSTQIKSILLI